MSSGENKIPLIDKADAKGLTDGEKLKQMHEVSEVDDEGLIVRFIMLVDLVKKARTAQKNFYAEKDRKKKDEYLEESKKLERQIDHQLTTMGYNEQLSIFQS